METRTLPQGYSFGTTRGGLTSVLDADGNGLVYALDEATALKGFFAMGQAGHAHKVDSFVDL